MSAILKIRKLQKDSLFQEKKVCILVLVTYCIFLKLGKFIITLSSYDNVIIIPYHSNRIIPVVTMNNWMLRENQYYFTLLSIELATPALHLQSG